MTKTKTKTQITAYVTQELGEWLRNYAHEHYPKSQGAIIRQALKEFKQRCELK